MRLTTEIPLVKAIPSERIFSYMSNVSFIPSPFVAEYLDDEYFANISGNKQVSPLVEKLSARNWNEGELETRLANIILNRYRVKWQQMFDRFADLETLNLLNNINIVKEIKHGKISSTQGSDILSKSGTETETTMLDETKTESYNPLNPRTSSRSISGKYTDSTNETSTRSGTEEVLESFPTERKSTKKTTGGYSDSDSVTNTRSGSQKTTDKGGTETSVYGFNSSNPVPSQIVAPEDYEMGTTSELTFGQEGLIDAHSGAITRTYDPVTGLIEETSETGQRKTATTYGQDGLQDSLKSGTTRTYDNYKDEITESGEKTLSTSYGQNGKTVETSFAGRQDSHSISETVSNSGKDTETETGYKYDSLITEYLTLFTSGEYMDFLSIIYSDCDEILTCPYYV